MGSPNATVPTFAPAPWSLSMPATLDGAGLWNRTDVLAAAPGPVPGSRTAAGVLAAGSTITLTAPPLFTTIDCVPPAGPGSKAASVAGRTTALGVSWAKVVVADNSMAAAARV